MNLWNLIKSQLSFILFLGFCFQKTNSPLVLLNSNLFLWKEHRDFLELNIKVNAYELWKCWFLRRGENLSTRRKTSRSKGENQQQTQPTLWCQHWHFNPATEIPRDSNTKTCLLPKLNNQNLMFILIPHLLSS